MRLKIIMAKIIKKEKYGRTCKHCGFTFADEIEMFQSLRHGYFTCQPCFNELREKKILP